MFLKGPLGFFSMQKTLYCCCYNFNVICGESPRHTWVYCVPCGVCNQRTLAKRKGHAKKNTPAICLFHSEKVHLLNMPGVGTPHNMWAISLLRSVMIKKMVYRVVSHQFHTQDKNLKCSDIFPSKQNSLWPYLVA